MLKVISELDFNLTVNGVHFVLAPFFIIIKMSRDQLVPEAYPVTSSKNDPNITGHKRNSLINSYRWCKTRLDVDK